MYDLINEQSMTVFDNYASNITDRASSSISLLLNDKDTQDKLASYGIKLGSVKQDQIKNAFAMFGVYALFSMLKSNMLKTALLGGVAYYALNNKKQLEALYTKVTQGVQLDSIA